VETALNDLDFLVIYTPANQGDFLLCNWFMKHTDLTNKELFINQRILRLKWQYDTNTLNGLVKSFILSCIYYWGWKHGYNRRINIILNKNNTSKQHYILMSFTVSWGIANIFNFSHLVNLNVYKNMNHNNLSLCKKTVTQAIPNTCFNFTESDDQNMLLLIHVIFCLLELVTLCCGTCSPPCSVTGWGPWSNCSLGGIQSREKSYCCPQGVSDIKKCLTNCSITPETPATQVCTPPGESAITDTVGPVTHCYGVVSEADFTFVQPCCHWYGNLVCVIFTLTFFFNGIHVLYNMHVYVKGHLFE
jgi:hypothetical protein